jgi:hypothetical protein
VNRLQFAADHQRRFGVKRMGAIVGTARSGFSYGRRTAADAKLAARTRTVHRDSDGTYGVRG